MVLWIYLFLSISPVLTETHRTQPVEVFLVRLSCINEQDIQVEIPYACLIHIDSGHRIQGLPPCNVFSLLFQDVDMMMSVQDKHDYHEYWL